MTLAKSLILGVLMVFGLCGPACSKAEPSPPLPATQAEIVQASEPGAKGSATKREIAQEVSLKLRAADPRKAGEQLGPYVESQGGYLVSSRSGSEGFSEVDAEYSFRIPVNKLNAALTHLRQIGELLTESRKGEDLTTDVVDTEARLISKRTLEKRLLELLSAAHNVDESLKVEAELARIRTEIEQLMGHARALSERTAFALVQVALVSPEPSRVVASRTFGARLVGALSSSLSTSENVILGIIEVAGALIPLALLGLGVWLPARHWYRRSRARARARMVLEAEQAQQ